MATRLSRPLLRTHRQFTSPSHSSTLQLPQALSLRHNHTQHTHTPPIFSSNVRDHSKALTSLSPLLKSPDLDQSSAPSAATTAVAEGGKWTLIPSRMGVERTYKFKTFKQAWGFMSVVAEKCEVEKHHPEWFNVSLFRHYITFVLL